jgi:hypothetical protein
MSLLTWMGDKSGSPEDGKTRAWKDEVKLTPGLSDFPTFQLSNSNLNYLVLIYHDRDHHYFNPDRYQWIIFHG